MTDFMTDLPEHLAIPVTREGQGPAEEHDIDHWQCWCPAGAACVVLPPQNPEQQA